MLKRIMFCVFAVLAFAVASVASATPKDDYWAALKACPQAPPVTDALIACHKAALLDLIVATSPALQQQLQQTPAAKKIKLNARDAGNGRFITSEDAKAHPNTTVIEKK